MDQCSKWNDSNSYPELRKTVKVKLESGRETVGHFDENYYRANWYVPHERTGLYFGCWVDRVVEWRELTEEEQKNNDKKESELIDKKNKIISDLLDEQ